MAMCPSSWLDGWQAGTCLLVGRLQGREKDWGMALVDAIDAGC